MSGLPMRSRKKSRYLQTNENEDKTTQNLWETETTVLRGKFIALQAYLAKQEKAQINNLTLHLKELEKINKAQCE